MAPMAISESHSLKRTSSIAQFDEPAAKKLNRGRVRHHKAAWDLQREQRYSAAILNDGDVQSLLTRSIGLALEAVGFEAAAPDAIDSFRGDVEECMRDLHEVPAAQQYADSHRHGALSRRCATVYALLPSHNTHTSRLPTSIAHPSA